MKSLNPLKLLFVTLLLSLLSFNSTAQTRVGIVFAADTTLVYQRTGLTIFSCHTTPLPPFIAFSNYIQQSLEKQLIPYNYTINVCEIPNSIRNVENVFFEFGLAKELQRWAATKQEEYDILIFVGNMSLILSDTSVTPLNTSGVLTKASWVFLYSTISFNAYDINKTKLAKYIQKGPNFLYRIKDFKLPKDDDKKFTPENINLIKDEFKKYIDDRVEYFITESFLIPENKEKRYKDDLY